MVLSLGQRLEIQVKGCGHFGHFLHFCGLTYERDRVQRVKISGLQPEFASFQIVSQNIRIRPYYRDRLQISAFVSPYIRTNGSK